MSASAAPSNFSATNRAKIDATFAAARKRSLPEQPIRDRIAEGQAKGASEAQIVASAQRAEARLDITQRAMARWSCPAVASRGDERLSGDRARLERDPDPDGHPAHTV